MIFPDSHATINGHAMPSSGHAFENKQRVQTSDFDYDDIDRQAFDEQREIGRREVMVDLHRILQEGFDLVTSDANPVLAADCYKYTSGVLDWSEVQIAEKHGVTKAAVSKRVKQWQKVIGPQGLPPSASMRSDSACETFRKSTTKSWNRRLTKKHHRQQLKQ